MATLSIHHFVVGLVTATHREHTMSECRLSKNLVLPMNILPKPYDCNFKLCVDGVPIRRPNDSDVASSPKKKEVEKKRRDCFGMLAIEALGKGLSQLLRVNVDLTELSLYTKEQAC